MKGDNERWPKKRFLEACMNNWRLTLVPVEKVFTKNHLRGREILRTMVQALRECKELKRRRRILHSFPCELTVHEGRVYGLGATKKQDSPGEIGYLLYKTKFVLSRKRLFIHFLE